MSKKTTGQYRWLQVSLAAAGLTWASLAISQGIVGLNVAGEIRFPDLNNASHQESPLCFNSSSGFLGACAQVSGIRNIAWVAPEGGDYSSPLVALTEIDNWCGAPGDGNRCLIRIAPGSYDLGSQQLVMLPFVDIQGSGWNMTILQGARSAADGVEAALVKGAANSVLSALTIVNGGAGTQTYTSGFAAENLLAGGDMSPDLDQVTVKVSGNAANSYGIYLRNIASSRMENVRLEINGSSHCVGLRVEANENSGVVNRLYAHTANNCDSAVGVHLKDVEYTVSNSIISATSSGGNALGALIEENVPEERFSMIRDSELGAEVEVGAGNAVGVEFRGSGGGIINSVIVGEAGSGKGYGASFVMFSSGAKVLNSVLIGSTASVNDSDPSGNCKGAVDGNLADVGC